MLNTKVLLQCYNEQVYGNCGNHGNMDKGVGNVENQGGNEGKNAEDVVGMRGFRVEIRGFRVVMLRNAENRCADVGECRESEWKCGDQYGSCLFLKIFLIYLILFQNSPPPLPPPSPQIIITILSKNGEVKRKSSSINLRIWECWKCNYCGWYQDWSHGHGR